MTPAAERETRRFDSEVSGDEVIEGDRIAPPLVARTPEQLGDPYDPHADDPIETQLVAGTIVDTFGDDSVAAILVDPETGTLIRATRLASSVAWTQAEADWTVRDVGDRVRVTDVELEPPTGHDGVDDELEYVQDWVDVVFQDMAAGHFDYSDERELVSSTSLRLEDTECWRAIATIELVDDSGVTA